MKKLYVCFLSLISAILLFGVMASMTMLIGCDTHPTGSIQQGNIAFDYYEVTLNDGCEYIVTYYNNSRSICHKGLCNNSKHPWNVNKKDNNK